MENEDLSFIEIFQKIPKRIDPRLEFQKEIAELCGCSVSAVHKWCYGKNQPKNKLVLKKLSKRLKSKKLFPSQ